jgi:hypothetical protein
LAAFPVTPAPVDVERARSFVSSEQHVETQFQIVTEESERVRRMIFFLSGDEEEEWRDGGISLLRASSPGTSFVSCR